jgi:O-antigen/teichoic acid export membrane protein
MRHWFQDRHFQSLLRNSGYLAASRGATAICGLATLAFTGRGLGVVLFGLLVLIHSYAKAASSIIRFQSWQLIVHYGTRGLAAGEQQGFRDATGFAFALDVVSGILGMVLAIALLPLLADWFQIPKQYQTLAVLYCLLLPTMAAATPVGVLRALDRFDLLSIQGTFTPTSRAILTGLAWWFELPFTAYVLIWFVTDLAGDLLMWWLAAREMKRHGLLTGIRPNLHARGLDGGWKFAWAVNLTGSLAAAWGPVANLLVGGLLGPVSAGLYRISQTLIDSAAKPSDMLAKVFYPEVVRLDFKTGHPWRLMLRSAALTGAIGLACALVIAIGGRPLLTLLFGPEFAPAYPVLMVMILALLLTMIAFPLGPMLYGLDRANAPLIARAVGAGIYLATIVPLTSRYDVVGAAIAFVIGNAAMIALMMWSLWREYRRLRATR